MCIIMCPKKKVCVWGGGGGGGEIAGYVHFSSLKIDADSPALEVVRSAISHEMRQ